MRISLLALPHCLRAGGARRLTGSAGRHHLVRGGCAAAALTLALALAAALAPAASATAGGHVVRYHGYRLLVPAGWPVLRLRSDRTACVRFDRHAIYLGTPGADQRCPATAAGRTEAILVSPLSARATRMLPAASSAARGTETQLAIRSHRVLVTATWNRHPALIRRALGARSLDRAAATGSHRPASAVAYARARSRAFARRHATVAAATPGQIFTGSGFDACSTPSTAQMSAWGASPYRAIGVYIGGTNMACSQPNLSATWVSEQSAAGWHLIPIYVGLQAPTNSCGCGSMSSSPSTAGAQGAAAAQDAVIDAQAIGLGAGNPLYLDMEGYNTNKVNTPAVLAFVAGWTGQLHADGYKSGVYSSANSGIRDLASQYGTSYTEPDELWIASWNGQQSTSDPNVPAQDWAAHQRLHQYQGAHNETYQQVRINIDSDWVDASTAAAGTGPGAVPTPGPAPALAVSPDHDGSVALTPSWPYASGVASWQVLAGPSPTALTWVGPTAGAGGPLPIVTDNDFPYYAVQALGSAGQVLATSAPVPDPPHLAVFGSTAFVPQRGLGGLPVGCLAVSPCVLRAIIHAGRRTIARTGAEHVRGGEGLIYFKLSNPGRTLLTSAGAHGLQVSVRLRDVLGDSMTQPLRLNEFSTSDPRPRRTAKQSSALRFVGLTDFVSHGWVGGILARCAAGASCQVTTRIAYGRRVIAHTGQELLGQDELGYLLFTLTRTGHRLLAHAPGNQLPVRATISTTTPSGTATATARLALVAFP